MSRALHPHGGYAHFGCKCRGCKPPVLPDHAGIVLYRKARSTGTHVGLYKSAEAEIESDPEYPWSTVCEEHAGVVCHRTRKEAESYLSHPEDWCPTCQDKPEGTEGQDRKSYSDSQDRKHYT